MKNSGHIGMQSLKIAIIPHAENKKIVIIPHGENRKMAIIPHGEKTTTGKW